MFCLTAVVRIIVALQSKSAEGLSPILTAPEGIMATPAGSSTESCLNNPASC